MTSMELPLQQARRQEKRKKEISFEQTKVAGGEGEKRKFKQENKQKKWRCDNTHEKKIKCNRIIEHKKTKSNFVVFLLQKMFVCCVCCC